MGLFEAVASVFKNYAGFSGRARRSEYWMFSLFNILVYLVLGILFAALASDEDAILIPLALMGIYSLATILPSLAVMCRRLHDVGKSGAYIFFLLLPIVGEILLLVWEFQDGEPWTNAYGPDPKGRNLTPGYLGYGPVVNSPVVKPAATTERLSKKNCPNCGKSIDENAVFCTFCGVKMEPARTKSAVNRCSNCGSVLKPDARFCMSCGAPLSGTGESSATPSSPEGNRSGIKKKGFYIPEDLK